MLADQRLLSVNTQQIVEVWSLGCDRENGDEIVASLRFVYVSVA